MTPGPARSGSGPRGPARGGTRGIAGTLARMSTPKPTPRPATVRQGDRDKAFRPLPEADRRVAFEAGLACYAAGEFFEAHEAWEELWQEDFGPSRKFFQGLIQASVALHHFCNGNIRGAKKVFYGSCGYLEPYRPVHMGLDLDAFLGQLKTCFTEVIAATEEFPQIDIVADTIPEIHLDPPPPVPEAE